jgi:hypothetical protein
MAEQIIDGTGSGQKVKVDAQNRLHTHSVTEGLVEHASANGNSYNVNTGTITLTSATESSLLYLKNNSDFDIHIASIGYLMGNSTGGTGDINITVLRNPSLGTVVSDASIVAINKNKNVGSSKDLTADIFKGGEGKTITDGDPLYYSLVAGSARGYVIATGTIVVPKGGSIGVKLTPQTGNTSMGVQVFMSVTEYKIDKAL